MCKIQQQRLFNRDFLQACLLLLLLSHLEVEAGSAETLQRLNFKKHDDAGRWKSTAGGGENVARASHTYRGLWGEEEEEEEE